MDALAARSLMETVDVLGNDGAQDAVALPPGELEVRLIGFCGQADHLVAVEAVEFLGLLHEKGMAEDLFGRIIVLLMVETVSRTEIGDAALRGHARTAEKDDAAGILNDLSELFDIGHGAPP